MTIPNLDALVARYGENARVIDAILWERERKAAQARAELWREPVWLVDVETNETKGT